MTETFELLDLVALSKDLPEKKLQAGDVGTIVETFDGTAVIVEFIDASGDTQAVITLPTTDLRRVQPHEMLAVRSGGRQPRATPNP